MEIGVLALQGDFREHASALRSLGAAAHEVRLPEQLDSLDGLVIPGGESTTIARLMRLYELDEAILRFEGPIFGTCAGMIVLAREATDGVPSQRQLGLLDIVVQRNGYGRQVASFEADVSLEDGATVPGVFIRAPKIVSVGPAVTVLGRLDGDAVLVREGRVLASSFHPELDDDRRIHRSFLELVEEGRTMSLAGRAAS
jgi:5'-phosphate synthase pdxT subunit